MISSNEKQLLTIALQAVVKGLEKGVSEGFSKARSTDADGAMAALLAIPNMILQPSTIWDPGALRGLEEELRTSVYLKKGKERLQAAKAKFSQQISRASNITQAFFVPYLNLLDTELSPGGSKITEVGKALGLESDTVVFDPGEIQVISLDFNTKDDIFASAMGQILPLLRTKFDAIMAYQSVGFDSLTQSALSGDLTESETEIFSGLYRAILEWKFLTDSLSKSAGPLSPTAPESDDSAAPDESGVVAGPTARFPVFSQVISGITIDSLINPRDGFRFDINGTSGDVMLDRAFFTSHPLNSIYPAIDLLIMGDEADKLNSTEEDADKYIESFVDSGKIEFNASLLGNWKNYIEYYTRSSHPEGATISLFFRPDKLSELIATPVASEVRIFNAASEVRIFKIITDRSGEVYVKADDTDLLDSLYKVSSSMGVTPLYETISPGGERVIFTATDLVRNSGKIRDSRGRSFKPKKWKGKSLSDIVSSPGYGKVKKKKRSRK